MNVIVPVFLTIAYISKPTRNCHKNSQLGWDHVYIIFHDIHPDILKKDVYSDVTLDIHM